MFMFMFMFMYVNIKKGFVDFFTDRGVKEERAISFAITIKENDRDNLEPEEIQILFDSYKTEDDFSKEVLENNFGLNKIMQKLFIQALKSTPTNNETAQKYFCAV